MPIIDFYGVYLFQRVNELIKEGLQERGEVTNTEITEAILKTAPEELKIKRKDLYQRIAIITKKLENDGKIKRRAEQSSNPRFQMKIIEIL